MVYWAYKVVRYLLDPSITEVKPKDNNSHPNTYLLTYVYYVKTQTHEKAYLNSYLIIYKVVKFFKDNNKEVRTSNYKIAILLNLLMLVPKLLFWTIIRIITSLSKSVIIDSYTCAQPFRIYNRSFITTLCKERKLYDFFETITLHINTEVMLYFYKTLVPITHRRIFKTPSSKYNFNFKLLGGPKQLMFSDQLRKIISSDIVGIVNTGISEKIVHCSMRYNNTTQYNHNTLKLKYHHTALISLSDHENFKNFKKDSQYTFSSKNPCPFIGVNQTSSSKSVDGEPIRLSGILYGKEFGLKNNQSYTVLANPSMWYQTRHVACRDNTITRNSIWEEYGLSRVDLCLAIVRYPEEFKKVIDRLEKAEAFIYPDIRETIDVLSQIKTCGILDHFTEDELVNTLPRLLHNEFFPDTFDKSLIKTEQHIIHYDE